MTSLRNTFSDRITGRIYRPIGHTIISQSTSHVPSSSALSKLANLVDSTVPIDPIGDMLFIDPSDILTSRPDILTFSTNIPSSFTPALPPYANSIHAYASALVDSLVAIMGQMTVLIEQLACMMAKITHLRVITKRHTAEFAILHGMILYVQSGIRRIHEHSDNEDDDDDFDGAIGGDNAALIRC